MSRVKSIIEKQRASNSGAPFKYYVNEAAAGTGYQISNQQETFTKGMQDGVDMASGPQKAPTSKCPSGMSMDPETKKCVKTPPTDPDEDSTNPTLKVAEGLDGNAPKEED